MLPWQPQNKCALHPRMVCKGYESLAFFCGATKSLLNGFQEFQGEINFLFMIIKNGKTAKLYFFFLCKRTEVQMFGSIASHSKVLRPSKQFLAAHIPKYFNRNEYSTWQREIVTLLRYEGYFTRQKASFHRQNYTFAYTVLLHKFVVCLPVEARHFMQHMNAIRLQGNTQWRWR